MAEYRVVHVNDPTQEMGLRVADELDERLQRIDEQLADLAAQVQKLRAVHSGGTT